MSKQSERKRNELVKAKSANKLLNVQKDSQNQSTKPQSQPENGNVKPDAKRLYQRPGFLGIIGTVILTLACFIQLYSHISAIWTLFVSLIIYIQALRVELAEHKKSKTHSRYVGVIGVILSLAFCVFLTVIDAKNNPAMLPVVAQPQSPPDYIEGTEFTPKQLDEIFPFGYAVIYLNDDGEKQIHEIHNKRADWKLDWDKVKIEPNVTANKVTWTLPSNFSIKTTDGGLQFENNKFTYDTSFKKGFARLVLVNLGDDSPVIYVGILNDNQRKPVFVIGFKIPSPHR